MKLMIPVTDIMVAPGGRLNVSDSPDDIVIEKIRNAYGVIADVMDIHIQNGMVHIEFRNVTPEKVNEAMGKLKRGVSEAEEGRLLKAVKLFQEVLSMLPENVDARRNMARVYLNRATGKRPRNTCSSACRSIQRTNGAHCCSGTSMPGTSITWM